MTQRRVWFERTFTLGLPPEAFPDVLERLRGTPGRARERAIRVADAERIQRVEGKWSMQEHVGHLLDLDDLWSGRTQDLVDGKERLRDADLTNRRTEEAGHNDTDLETLLRQFAEVRGRWVETLEGLEDGILQRTALHPRLEQPMSIVDLAFFVAEHDDHHLAAMTALRHQR